MNFLNNLFLETLDLQMKITCHGGWNLTLDGLLGLKMVLLQLETYGTHKKKDG